MTKGKLLNKRTIVSFIFFLFCYLSIVFYVCFTEKWLNSDVWWIVSTGNQIISDGIPYTNTLAIMPIWIDSLPDTIIQQWLYDVMIAASTNILGMEVAIPFISILQLIVVIILILFTMRKLSNNRLPLWIMFLVLAIFSATFGQWSICPRPTAVTMIVITSIVLLLEHYKSNHNKMFLVAVLALILLHVNIHASMIMFSIAIVFLYAITESVRTKHCDFALLLTAFISIPVSCINPYGVNDLLYSLLSYGTASYGNIIDEMQPILCFKPYITLLFTINVALASLIIWQWVISKNKNYELLIILIIAIFLGMLNIRSIWMIAPATLLLFASLEDFKSITKLFNRAETLLLCVILALILPLYSLVSAYSENNVSFDEQIHDAQSVADIIRNNGEDGAITFFASGNILQYEGLKVTSDARPELWEPAITHIDYNGWKKVADVYADYTAFNIEHPDLIYNDTKSLITSYINNYDYSYVSISADNEVIFKQTLSENGYSLIYKGSYLDLWQKPSN